MLDDRLMALAKVCPSKKIIPSQIEFIDIAGLVKGASSGAGLGAKFLANVRSVSVILHLVRCFEGTDIIHTDDTIDPIRDIEVIETELLLSDLDLVQNRLTRMLKKNFADDLKRYVPILETIQKHLDQGISIRDLEWGTEDQKFVDALGLLSNKPTIYICNVDEDSAAEGNALSRKVEAFAADLNNKQQKAAVAAGKPVDSTYHYSSLQICAKLEFEASLLKKEKSVDVAAGGGKGEDSEMTMTEYLSMAGLEETGLQKIITSSARALKQQCFYTIGPEEARSWTIAVGCDAETAAGKIHSDIQRGFICAEVIKPNDYLVKGAAAAMKREGKAYPVEDGDIINFKFNVTKNKK